MRLELGACCDLTQCSFDTQDGLYDLAWSEIHENQIATGSGDGSVKLWDVTLAVRSLTGRTRLIAQDYPIRKWQEHQREVYSVDWSNVRKDLFSTSSWDHTVKIVRATRSAIV